ncbi:MAG: cryptochrome/photolyase family protein [Verrucomicrobiaceae bacterium]|nr:cryptochrome/photolyase family protein [Verrucomicrobiaceae bacterium]
MNTLWILGDQLSLTNSALAGAEQARDVVLMVESKARGKVLPYHQQKLMLIYAAMRHFAAELRHQGWQVDYVPLEDGLTFEEAARQHLEKFSPERFILAEPNSFFETDALTKLGRELGVPVQFVPTSQFLCGREEFQQWAGKGSGQRLLMENHYRRMRTQTGYLMQDGKPVGNCWNFDPENRRTFRDWKRSGQATPALPETQHDAITRDVIVMVAREFPDNPGKAEAFWLPVTRIAAKKWLARFIDERLPSFGDFEDIMSTDEASLYHSVLSPLLNIGLLSPAECVEAALEAYQHKRAPLNAVEGFVRQIIGWREFINGIYWLRGPEYRQLNGLHADRPLPVWFYTGDVPMNCLHQVLRQLIDTGWNHHIQRLMVLGNFMLLAGIRPQEALRWFSEMYVDAFDWVMAANVIGMICHADGGFMATKPYAASGAYIDKMSDYCAGCRYSPKVKTGPDACPFNYLYWHFFDQHAATFANNQRVKMPVNAWLKRSEEDKNEVRQSAALFLERNVPKGEVQRQPPSAYKVCHMHTGKKNEIGL